MARVPHFSRSLREVGPFHCNGIAVFVTFAGCAPSQRELFSPATLIAMPWNLTRYYGNGDLHFITYSCYQRQPSARQCAAARLISHCSGAGTTALSVRRPRLRGHARALSSVDQRTARAFAVDGHAGFETGLCAPRPLPDAPSPQCCSTCLRCRRSWPPARKIQFTERTVLGSSSTNEHPVY